MTAEQVIAHPLLGNGDVMSREEFHRLYSECEGYERVELIEGVVYLPSPTMFEGHTREQTLMLEWLLAYTAGRPEAAEAGGPGSVLLDDINEPEPDAMLFQLTPGRFEGGYVTGAPELVVEIANTSRSRDLHQKKRAYERNGVLEYIVWRTQDHAIDWFQLCGGVYVPRQPDSGGRIASEVFPGLVLDVPAMLAHDRKKVLAAVKKP